MGAVLDLILEAAGWNLGCGGRLEQAADLAGMLGVQGLGADDLVTVPTPHPVGHLYQAIQTFGVGAFVYTIPGSAENLLLWPTARGNYLRNGRPWKLLNNSPLPGSLFLLLNKREE